MVRYFLFLFGGIYAVTGIVILSAPDQFYEHTPGLTVTGPFNSHFIRDVALAFLASGGVVAGGAWKKSRSLVLAGVAWPALHALFHLQIWAVRGFLVDSVTLFDFTVVILPVGLTVWAALNLNTRAP